ncbi:MAG: hypothetical protein DMG10_29835 [Acidobacteria bacterium]|nr:MAG: hypothetical protein DMG10_29835 [Acidobacteriota bacterium]
MHHVRQLAGNARHAAIGSDLDCGFGKEHSPSDIESLADLRKIANLLRQVGYAEPDVEGVMHANWIRFFRKAWGPPDSLSRKDSRVSDVPALHFTHQVVAGSGTQRHDGKRRILAGAGGKP